MNGRNVKYGRNNKICKSDKSYKTFKVGRNNKMAQMTEVRERVKMERMSDCRHGNNVRYGKVGRF